MSLFQCDKCGCLENTALTNFYHGANRFNDMDSEAAKSYRLILGLKEGELFGKYCSACSPIWYDDNGDLGVGHMPAPTNKSGKWHGEFRRRFFPLNEMVTDANGNLEHKNGDKNISKYEISKPKDIP